MAAFRDKLQELGWAEGREVQIDVRWGGADINYIRASAADLVGVRPDVILVYSVRVLNAMQQATRDIPVVVVSADATARQIDRLMTAGASTYLTKPIDVTKFFQVLDKTTGVDIQQRNDETAAGIELKA